MQLVVRDRVAQSRMFSALRLRTRPLTVDELGDQLKDPETMRILCEIEGGHHA
jgi:hypothetical protein